ncbi:tRNA threonylcarbamoyladenosine biosynthesis protein TsaE [Pseudacidovorax sp. RU35E]|jgi:tRNA threonylcarbamoyladenosine biosynthesis protein TsaE|nr:tRNA threonylcarbamoyladenosine biosynthesis protein TsaE [Pseudacidovorax sp. RU35E]
MEALGQPFRQAGLCVGQVDARDADLGESEFPGPRTNPSHELSIDRSHRPIVEIASRPLLWQGEDDTARFAQALAQAMQTRPELSHAFITLHGDLGAGKTTFVRHLLRALGVQGRIKSPTYAVVEPHTTRDGRAVYHFDFYRFSNPREWEDAGFRDLFAGEGLKLAEWPAQAAGYLPTEDLAIHIEAMTPDADDVRRVQLRAFSLNGQALLAAVAP